ncbi:MAG: hypothetical protein NZ866_01590 [Patescibacteria group bacterium]|nr:hypothetical protein [Patescibacteria group bacterium]
MNNKVNIFEKIISYLFGIIYTKKLLLLFIILLISFLIFYSTYSQGQRRYTVFRTDNDGFKFYKWRTGNSYAPVFGDHVYDELIGFKLNWWEDNNSNQLVTKFNLLSSELAKFILFPAQIDFRRAYTWYFPPGGNNPPQSIRDDNLIRNIFLGSRSWVEGEERFKGNDYPASISFESDTNGILGGFRDLRDLPIPPSRFKKIRLQAYINDSGFCVVSFSKNRVDARNLDNLPFVKIFIVKDVSRRIFDVNYNLSYFNANNYERYDYWWNNFGNDYARYWSVHGHYIPLDINLDEIIMPANTNELIIRKYSDGSDGPPDDRVFNGDWYLIYIKIRRPSTVPFPISNLFDEFRYAYIEGQLLNGWRHGGVACKVTVYTDKFLQ